MIVIYYDSKNKNKNKEIDRFFTEYKLKTKYIDRKDITKEDILIMLKQTSDGFLEIINEGLLTKHKVYYDSFKVNEFVEFLLQNKKYLSLPFIYDTKKEGKYFSSSDIAGEDLIMNIRKFIPRHVRKRNHDMYIRMINGQYYDYY